MAQPRETEPGGLDTMTDWTLRRYTPEDAAMWDERVRAARNPSFLHLRGYMEYHSDRFTDCSLIAMRRGKVAALLPADLTPDGTLRSHGGLTCGGWILPCGHIDGADVLALFEAWRDWCRAEGIRRIDYCPLPYIYHRQPASEDLYALFRMGAVQAACGLSATIDYTNRAGFNTLQRRHLRKALALAPTIEETENVTEFHDMLRACLAERHGAVPVHTREELQLLRDRFPDNIRLFCLRLDGELMAGVCMYITPIVAHAQYIATTPQGRRLNMLTPLFDRLIELFSTSSCYFDFGISTEEGGAVLNDGLLRQKFSLGGSGTVYQRFILDI